MLQVERASGAVGAYISGVDLRAVDADLRTALLDAWHVHGVLFFRGQHLDADEQVAAAWLFGEPEHFEMAHPVAGHEFVHKIETVDVPRRYGGATRWHSDATWKPRPPRASMLQAVDLPEVGGDTLFASANGAYESLSEPIRRLLLGLTATHAGGDALARAGERVGRAVPDPVHHPVVRRHPATGLPVLYVNSVFTQRIDDVSARESASLLPLLVDQFKDPELQCRFRWEPGDIAIWDNRAVQHYAVPDYAEPRLMHRVVLAGDPVDDYTT